MEALSYANEQRLLKIKRVEEILKEILPMDKDEVLSQIMYRLGFTEKRAKDYIKLLFDNHIIDYGKDGKLSCTKKPE